MPRRARRNPSQCGHEKRHGEATLPAQTKRAHEKPPPKGCGRKIFRYGEVERVEFSGCRVDGARRPFAGHRRNYPPRMPPPPKLIFNQEAMAKPRKTPDPAGSVFASRSISRSALVTPCPAFLLVVLMVQLANTAMNLTVWQQQFRERATSGVRAIGARRLRLLRARR